MVLYPILRESLIKNQYRKCWTYAEWYDVCLPSAWIWDFSYFIPFIKTLRWHITDCICIWNAACHHWIGSEAWQPMEIQTAYLIKHASSFIMVQLAGWMTFNITIKCLFWLSQCFISCCGTSVYIYDGNSSSIWQITEPRCKGSGLSIDFFIPRDATCIQQHDIQYAYVIKVKIWHETLMNREIEGAAQKRNCFAEGNVELF